MSDLAEKLYNERRTRVFDAIHLKEPDRVPLIPVMEGFPMYYADLTIQEAMYDYYQVEGALDKFYQDFQPDLAWDPIMMYPAKFMEILGINWFRWPGRGVADPNAMYQFIEDEYMKADEYDELLFDPTQFMLTKWIPRSFSALKGLSNLSLRNSMWFGFFNSFNSFAAKEVHDSLQTLMKASDEIAKWYAFLGKYDQKLEQEMGFPVAYGGFGYAPFDMLGDSMRGTIPILEDLHDRPEKILAVMDKFIPMALESAIASAKATGRPFIWIWLHKGVDEFMSIDTYEKFYWKSLKTYLLGLIEAGLTPIVYCEGSYNRRLEILRDVPKGKLVYDFETVDMAKAKKILGDVACIAGNVPNYLLAHGTKQEVEYYCKKLIDDCGSGGGFMMDSSALIDDAKPENLKMMFEVTQTYGIYK